MPQPDPLRKLEALAHDGQLRKDLLAAVTRDGETRVGCTTCGREEVIDGGAALRDGWPKCHGHTMRLMHGAEDIASVRAAQAHGTSDRRARHREGPVDEAINSLRARGDLPGSA